MVLMVAINKDDHQIVVVEFSAEPGQVVQALAGQGPVPEVPELDDPVHLVLTSRREQDVLPVQVVAVGVAGDQEAGRVVGEGRGHEMKVPLGPSAKRPLRGQAGPQAAPKRQLPPNERKIKREKQIRRRSPWKARRQATEVKAP